MERPKSNRFRWKLIGGVILALVVLISVLIDILFLPAVQIGPETTFLKPARRPDGTLDFATALHERLSDGVDEKDNAAVLLVRAFGPGVIAPAYRSQFFNWMKMQPLPEQGDYIVSATEFVRQKHAAAGDNPNPDNDPVWKELTTITQQPPWTEEDFLLAAEWLERNAEPLKLIVQATKRSQCYSPIVTATDLFEGEGLTNDLREAARLLLAQAMFRLGHDDVAGAWDHLLACHRLASLLGSRSPNVIQTLISIAVDNIASSGDAMLIAHQLSAEQAKKCLADHLQLPPIGKLEEMINLGERVGTLDALLHQLPSIGVDSNLMLRRANKVFDEIGEALKDPDFATREKLLNELEKELKARSVAATKLTRVIPRMMLAPRRAITESVGDVLLALKMPSLAQANQAQTRADVRRDLVRIGFALAAFQADKDAFPQSLDELVPGYLETIPSDRFTGLAYQYEPREKGFLICSFGANGRDDQGEMHPPDQDDISFEVPPRREE